MREVSARKHVNAQVVTDFFFPLNHSIANLLSSSKIFITSSIVFPAAAMMMS